MAIEYRMEQFGNHERVVGSGASPCPLPPRPVQRAPVVCSRYKTRIYLLADIGAQ